MRVPHAFVSVWGTGTPGLPLDPREYVQGQTVGSGR